MRTFIPLVCLISLAYIPVFGQQAFSENKAAQKSYQNAGMFISNRDYEKALKELQKAVEADPGFVAAYQQLGDIYRRQKDYGNAVIAYNKVLKLNPAFHSLSYYGLAESEFNTGDYEGALKHFEHYTALQGISAENRKKAEKYIADARFGIQGKRSPVPYVTVNLGPAINTSNDEYLPAISADESRLIFTRLAGNNEDFFISKKTGKDWDKAIGLSSNINTPGNEGAQCISPDGNYLFFTACDRQDGLGRCDIYVSKWEDEDWSEPFNLGAPINTSGWESQPSISADGRTLYFVSTRAGGHGGYDIWSAELGTNGTWTAPKNLGPEINTPYDEHSPFIHPDNETLYFSSNGWPGYGNKDIFLSRRKEGPDSSWGKPVNIGYPINSHMEESSLVISANGKTAWMASGREGGAGGLDIYSFELPAASRPKPVTYVKGIVKDKASGAPLSSSVKIVDLGNGRKVFEEETSGRSGTFLSTLKAGSNFSLHVIKPGYLFYSMNFRPEIKDLDKPFTIEVPLEKIETGGSAVLNNIFFDLNRSELSGESKIELNELAEFLRINPSLKIEIGGHTDQIGSDEANLELSLRRAKAVYEYLIFNKIPALRLTYKGYGETVPVSTNESPEGRALNRRTEFRIIAR